MNIGRCPGVLQQCLESRNDDLSRNTPKDDENITLEPRQPHLKTNVALASSADTPSYSCTMLTGTAASADKQQFGG
jgi:hypothetical protein